MYVYLSTSAAAKVLHMKPDPIRGLIRRGSFPDPDVLIGTPKTPEVLRRITEGAPLTSSGDLDITISGWTTRRIQIFGQEAGIIGKNGDPIVGQDKKIGRPAGRKNTRRKASWTCEPVLLLSYMGVAKLADTDPYNIRFAHKGGFFPAPTAQVDKIYGWETQTAIIGLQQLGHAIQKQE